MELGNMAFGHSRGGYPVPRNWERDLFRLFDAYSPDRDKSWREYGEEFVNDVFEVHLYYWDNCKCGHDAREKEWDSQNEHRPECYQSVLKAALAELDEATPEPEMYGRLNEWDISVETVESGMSLWTFDTATDPSTYAWREWHQRRRDTEEAIYDELCARFGVDRVYGCAVHCTCDLPERWDKFAAENTHVPTCPVVLPNFWYKPTDFRIDVYKYFLRDSFSNREITRREFRKIIDACIRSLACPA